MPNIAIQLTAGQLPPNVCFTNEQARFNAYVAAIQSSLPLNFTTVIVSSTAPGPDDRDKIWISIDGAGRILGTNLFSNGVWQSIFPVPPYVMPGEIRMYDPSLYTPAQTADEPWLPCDGTVGTTATPPVPNMNGCFIVGAGQRTLTSAQIVAGETATVFVQGTPLGAEQNTIPLTALPPHSHTPGKYDGVNADAFFLTGTNGGNNGTGNSSFSSHETPMTSVAGGTYNPVTGLTTQGTFSCLPPYQPVHFMQWRPDLV